MSTVISLNDFKNRDNIIEFSWGFEPDKFYKIPYTSVDRIFYLLSLDKTITAIFRYI